VPTIVATGRVIHHYMEVGGQTEATETSLGPGGSAGGGGARPPGQRTPAKGGVVLPLRRASAFDSRGRPRGVLG
jgi:hypothetical protein